MELKNPKATKLEVWDPASHTKEPKAKMYWKVGTQTTVVLVRLRNPKPLKITEPKPHYILLRNSKPLKHILEDWNPNHSSTSTTKEPKATKNVLEDWNPNPSSISMTKEPKATKNILEDWNANHTIYYYKELKATKHIYWTIGTQTTVILVGLRNPCH